jgi:site-specific recombinase XerD
MAPVVYIHNRWINPSDRVVIRHPDYTKGHYHDADHIMIYLLFQMVVDYVEIECSVFPATKNSFETRWQSINRFIHEIPLLHWFLKPTRNARRGLHNLRWQMKMKDHDSQRDFAKDIFKIYKFWVHDRPTRKDPFERYYALREGKDWKGKLTAQERKCLNAAQKLEAKYERQDQAMLHLIIKNRSCLWT